MAVGRGGDGPARASRSASARRTQPVIEGMYGMSYDHAGPPHRGVRQRSLAALLRGEPVDVDGEDFDVRGVAAAPLPRTPVPGARRRPRAAAAARRRAQLDRRHDPLDGQRPRRSSRTCAPLIGQAAADAGRPAPRIVAGCPSRCTTTSPRPRAVAARQFAVYGALPNYQRILDHGGAAGPADAAIVGDEAAVAAQIEALFDAGATDVWAAPLPRRRRPRGIAPAHPSAAARPRSFVSTE